MPEQDDDALDAAGRARRKEKVRSVWISFVGRIVATIIGAVASVVLGIFVLQRYQAAPATPPAEAPAASRTPGQHTIAVLPLDNYSGNPDDAYFAAGNDRLLISDLAQLQGWRVISRTSMGAYRDTTKSISQIGSELQASLVVEGSVTKAADR